MRENEAVVSLDFAENYGFIIQDEAQFFYWNNDQATIFPVAVHYKTGVPRGGVWGFKPPPPEIIPKL
jgi:hypothetical protein